MSRPRAPSCCYGRSGEPYLKTPRDPSPAIWRQRIPRGLSDERQRDALARFFTAVASFVTLAESLEPLTSLLSDVASEVSAVRRAAPDAFSAFVNAVRTAVIRADGSPADRSSWST